MSAGRPTTMCLLKHPKIADVPIGTQITAEDSSLLWCQLAHANIQGCAILPRLAPLSRHDCRRKSSSYRYLGGSLGGPTCDSQPLAFMWPPCGPTQARCVGSF